MSGARFVTNEMFLVSARTLAQQVSYADLAQGRVYPSLPKIREVSAAIAVKVAEVAYKRGLATRPQPEDLTSAVKASMYYPEYQRFA